MAKYLVMHGMVGEWLQGAEVTAEDLGGAGNIDRLIKLGAIEEAGGAAQSEGAAPVGTDGPPSPSLTTGQPGGAVGAPAAQTQPVEDPLQTAVGDVSANLRGAGFGTIEAIKAASDEDLAKVPGVDKAAIKKLRALK